MNQDNVDLQKSGWKSCVFISCFIFMTFLTIGMAGFFYIQKNMIEIPAQGEEVAQPEEKEAAHQEEGDGFYVRSAQLNDVFQFLAKEAEMQYFHNSELHHPDYLVTGRIGMISPLIDEIDALASRYGMEMVIIRDTIYAFTPDQLALRKQAIEEVAEKAIMEEVKQDTQLEVEKVEGITNMEKVEDGFFLREVKLNDAFKFIIENGDLGYWLNPELESDDYKAIGHLKPISNPLEEVEELAIAFGLRVVVTDGVVHVFTPSQYDKQFGSSK